MTTPLSATAPADGSPSETWRETSPGMWTSHAGNDIAGTDQLIGTFITTNARGDVTGTYDTLPQAQAALLTPSADQRRRRVAARRCFSPWARRR